jgi:hypothetical protein
MGGNLFLPDSLYGVHLLMPMLLLAFGLQNRRYETFTVLLLFSVIFPQM